jgi:hypothetical protein
VTGQLPIDVELMAVENPALEGSDGVSLIRAPH